MNDPDEATPPAIPGPGELDLGTWLGRRQAFGSIAGRCSAAEAECLRRIRDEKLYKKRTAQWGDFCAEYLGISKTQADKTIRLLTEFGPTYFQVSQLTRISPDTYRAIAPSINEHGIRHQGEVIALLPENAEKVQKAIAALRDQTANATPARVAFAQRLSALEKRCAEVALSFDNLYHGVPGTHDKARLDDELDGP